MLPNRKNEKFFLDLINNGQLELTRNGKVKNLITNRWIGFITTAGYKSIGYKDNGKTLHILVHRLMWLYFIGNIPNKMQVNHKDGVKTNLKLNNLELVTSSGNRKHAVKTGLWSMSVQGRKKISKTLKKKRGELSHMAKLTNKQAMAIREKYSKGISQEILAINYKVSSRTICDIVNYNTFRI